MLKVTTRFVGILAALSIGAPLVAGSATPASAGDAGSAVAAGLLGGAVGVMVGAAAARPAPPPVVVMSGRRLSNMSSRSVTWDASRSSTSTATPPARAASGCATEIIGSGFPVGLAAGNDSRYSIATISASPCMTSTVSPTLLPNSAVAIGAT
jgi:hypothetical protein